MAVTRFARLRLPLILSAVLVLVAAIVISSVAEMRWRAQVVGAKLRGEVPEISMAQLLTWLKPGSPIYLEAIASHQSMNSAVHNIRSEDAEVIAAGEKKYQQACSHCHGGDAKGGAGPNLVAFVGKATDWDFLRTVKWGRPNTAMIAQPLSDDEILSVHAFLRRTSRDWAAPTRDELKQSRRVDVPFSKLLNSAKHPEEWLTYSGDLAANRHSSLAQINKKNVRDLSVAWVAQLLPATKPLSANPIVANGVMFVTEAPDGVVALDAASGKILWRFNRQMDMAKTRLCCGSFNRGVALLDDKVFVATLDSHLVALNSSTGKLLWDIEVAESELGYSMTSAPLALDGAIVVGVAGAEFGIRGFVAAYSAADGKLIWKFNVIPEPGQPGSESWAGDSWKTGGGSTWSIGSYDAERDVIYWTVGNPWPPLDIRSREGDNLYTNSVVALDRKTGKLLWYFQFTPADSHDWDATQQLVLADVQWKGETIPAVFTAGRNAFYYVLDRRNGKFLYTKPFVKQTWAKTVDANGRPERDLDALPSRTGSLVWPWMHGGTNWWAASYDSSRRLHYIPTVDAATLYFSADMKYKASEMTMGGNTQLATNVPSVVAVKAINPDTGEIKWTARLDEGDFHQFSRMTGLVSTDGGIVVSGFEDRLSILDADSGEKLWGFRPGAQVNAGAITYSLNGVQYISVIAGNALFAFALPNQQGAK